MPSAATVMKLTAGRSEAMAAPSDRNEPEVTVLLPVRNGAATLKEAARSILGQDFRNFELLVVDDGSEDATPSVLQDLAHADERVRVVRQEKLGLVPALNRGLAEARAKLIARMDADDVALPDRLTRQAALLASAPSVALVGTGWRVVAADGSTRRVVLPPSSDAGLRTAMATANTLAHPTVMMRREAVLRAGSYRPAFLLAEDFDLWLRLMDRHQAACIPEVLLDYREHAGQSAWRDLEQRMLSEMGSLAAQDRRQVGRPDLGDDKAPIDRARLRLMGMTDEEVAAGLVARALGAAKDARAAGQASAMRRAALLGLRQEGAILRTRAHFALLWAQSMSPGRWSRS